MRDSPYSDFFDPELDIKNREDDEPMTKDYVIGKLECGKYNAKFNAEYW